MTEPKRPSRLGEDYVCIQCGPDPRGGDKHAWYAHTMDGLMGMPYPDEAAHDESEKGVTGTPDGTRVIAHRVDGAMVDVTEGVQALYDLVLGSMDWGSGFWTADDAEPVAVVARACGFAQIDEVERYITERREYDERTARMNRERQEQEAIRAALPSTASIEIQRWELFFTGDVTNDHAHAFEEHSLKCVWPGCSLERRLKDA